MDLLNTAESGTVITDAKTTRDPRPYIDHHSDGSNFSPTATSQQSNKKEMRMANGNANHDFLSPPRSVHKPPPLPLNHNN